MVVHSAFLPRLCNACYYSTLATPRYRTAPLSTNVATTRSPLPPRANLPRPTNSERQKHPTRPLVSPSDVVYTVIKSSTPLYNSHCSILNFFITDHVCFHSISIPISQSRRPLTCAAHFFIRTAFVFLEHNQFIHYRISSRNFRMLRTTIYSCAKFGPLLQRGQQLFSPLTPVDSNFNGNPYAKIMTTRINTNRNHTLSNKYKKKKKTIIIIIYIVKKAT